MYAEYLLGTGDLHSLFLERFCLKIHVEHFSLYFLLLIGHIKLANFRINEIIHEVSLSPIENVTLYKPYEKTKAEKMST